LKWANFVILLRKLGSESRFSDDDADIVSHSQFLGL